MKLFITNVTLDSSCLLPALFAGIGRRRQGCVLGTDTALGAVTVVQETRNTFVLIANFWGGEILLLLFYRCLCTAGLIGQSWNRLCANRVPSLERFLECDPYLGAHKEFPLGFAAPFWDHEMKELVPEGRKQTLRGHCQRVPAVTLAWDVSTLVFSFCLCWCCFNVFVFLFCLEVLFFRSSMEVL